MVNVNRRQALALRRRASCRACCSAARRFARRQGHADDRLQRQPALLRSDRRAFVGQSDHPGDLPLDLRSIYRAEARPVLRARPADRLGLERRQDQGLDGRARGRRTGTTARRSRRRTSSGRSSAPAIQDGGNPVAFVWAGIGNFKIDGKRITADVKQFDPTIFKWMAFLTGYVLPKAYYEKVGAEGFEKKPIGTGPYMVDEYQGNAFLRLKAQRQILGPQAGVRDRGLQVRAGRDEPRGRNRERLVRRHARNSLRGIRPAEGQDRPDRRLRRRSPTSA